MACVDEVNIEDKVDVSPVGSGFDEAVSVLSNALGNSVTMRDESYFQEESLQSISTEDEQKCKDRESLCLEPFYDEKGETKESYSFSSVSYESSLSSECSSVSAPLLRPIPLRLHCTKDTDHNQYAAMPQVSLEYSFTEDTPDTINIDSNSENDGFCLETMSCIECNEESMLSDNVFREIEVEDLQFKVHNESESEVYAGSASLHRRNIYDSDSISSFLSISPIPISPPPDSERMPDFLSRRSSIWRRMPSKILKVTNNAHLTFPSSESFNKRSRCEEKCTLDQLFEKNRLIKLNGAEGRLSVGTHDTISTTSTTPSLEINNCSTTSMSLPALVSNKFTPINIEGGKTGIESVESPSSDVFKMHDQKLDTGPVLDMGFSKLFWKSQSCQKDNWSLYDLPVLFLMCIRDWFFHQ